MTRDPIENDKTDQAAPFDWLDDDPLSLGVAVIVIVSFVSMLVIGAIALIVAVLT
jgi:hypothetical protein